MLLFFWEEEITRWRLLGVEEKEIESKLREDGVSEGYRRELEGALRIVKARKRVLPSARDESGRVIGDEGEERLPSYAEARTQRWGSI